MYGDTKFITAWGLEFPGSNHVNGFEPLDQANLADTNDLLGFDIAPIARSDFGDQGYLRPGSSETDVVYITHHDGGDTEVYAESVAIMVEKLKAANGLYERNRN